MNITITNRRFAVKPLLLCLTLLVASVSGPQISAANSDGSSSDMEEYEWPAGTLNLPGVGIVDVYFVKMKGYSAQLKAAIAMAAKAKEIDEAESPDTGKAYLVAARELFNCLQFETELHVDEVNLYEFTDPGDSLEASYLLDICLEEAEKNDADRMAVGEIYYGMGLMYSKEVTYYRTEGDMLQANRTHTLVLDYMQKARDRGDARAEAFLKAIEK